MKTVVELVDYKQTIDQMKRLVKMYSGDTVLWNNLQSYFDYVKNLPYQKDENKIEIVQRPAFTLAGNDGSDCKKKAVAMAAYFEARKIPWRFIISSTRKDKKPHHVFVQFFDSGNWINADATYKRFKIGESKILTFYQVV
jgi:transglutaminase-like putative cysteine protease